MPNTNTPYRATRTAAGINKRENASDGEPGIPNGKSTTAANRPTDQMWMNLPIHQAREQLEDSKKRLLDFKNEMKSNLDLIPQLVQYINELNDNICSLNVSIANLTSEIQTRDETIGSLNESLTAKESENAVALAAANQNKREEVQQKEKEIDTLKENQKDILAREYPDAIKQSVLFQNTLEPLLSSRIQQSNQSAYMARSILVILSHYRSSGTEVFFPLLLREFSRAIAESQAIARVSSAEAQKELETWLELFNEVELLKVDDNTWYSIQIPYVGGNVDISSMSYSGNGYSVSRIITWSIFLNGSILYKSDVQ